MSPTYNEVLLEVLAILRQLGDDWEYGGAITAETWLIRDLGFESLEIVVLGASIQRHYGQPLSFSDFLADVGQRDEGDIVVGEWVGFIHAQLSTSVEGELPQAAQLDAKEVA